VLGELPAHLGDGADRVLRLDLGGRDVVLFDLRRLVHALRDDLGVEVTGLYATPEALHRYVERELKLKVYPRLLEPVPDLADEPVLEVPETEPVDEAHAEEPASGSEEALEPDDAGSPQEAQVAQEDTDPGRRTLTIRRTLRSGTTAHFDGDIVVFGDVNPGAEVVASGSITVLGALLGMAHAGATGDETCFILAFDLRPHQLRIGRKIALAPRRETPGSGPRPEHAVVIGTEIVLQPFRSRLFRQPSP
jgi:septum site-determining protein MinC